MYCMFLLLQTLLEEVGGFTAWNRRWCVMQGDLISFWRFPDEEDCKVNFSLFETLLYFSSLRLKL